MTKKVSATREQVRKFGIMFGVIAVALAAYSFYKVGHAWPWLLAVGGFFFATGLFLYPVLRPLYIGWMSFAYALAWVNTRILLGLFFYLILTPIGLVLRLLGKDLLDERIDGAAKSYWVKRERVAFDRSRYERLF